MSGILYKARKKVYDILQNRELSLTNRLIEILEYSKYLQKNIFNVDYEEKNNEVYDKKIFCHELKEIYKNTEPINDEWTEFINNENLDFYELLNLKEDFKISNEKRFYEYEHFAVYTIFRYFMKSLWSGNLVSVIKFLVVNLIFIYILDIRFWKLNNEKFALIDRINTVKFWSKQIEYCQENLDIIFMECYKNPFLNSGYLVEFLKNANLF